MLNPREHILETREELAKIFQTSGYRNLESNLLDLGIELPERIPFNQDPEVFYSRIIPYPSSVDEPLIVEPDLYTVNLYYCIYDVLLAACESFTVPDALVFLLRNAAVHDREYTHYYSRIVRFFDHVAGLNEHMADFYQDHFRCLKTNLPVMCMVYVNSQIIATYRLDQDLLVRELVRTGLPYAYELTHLGGLHIDKSTKDNPIFRYYDMNGRCTNDPNAPSVEYIYTYWKKRKLSALIE